MIRLITGATCVDGKTIRPSDGPFHASPEVEKRLVERGVAVYATSEPIPVAPEVPDGAGTGTEDTAEVQTGELTESQLRKMKKADLLAIAAQKGIDADEDTKNSDIVDLILAEMASDENEDAPPETAPEVPE